MPRTSEQHARQLDDLLQSPCTTLLQVLQCPSTLEVMRDLGAAHRSLHAYMIDGEALSSILELVTGVRCVTEKNIKDPPSLSFEASGHLHFASLDDRALQRLVHAAIELIAVAPDELLVVVVDHTLPHMEHLFLVLDLPSPLGSKGLYFSALASVLLARQPEQVIAYLKSNKRFVTRLLAHLECAHVLRFLGSLIRAYRTQWLCDQGLVPSLLEGLAQPGAEFAVRGMIVALEATDDMVLVTSPLKREMYSFTTCNWVFKHVLDCTIEDVCLPLILFSKYVARGLDEARRGTVFLEKEAEQLPGFLRALLLHFREIAALLDICPGSSAPKARLGENRLHLVRFLSRTIQLNCSLLSMAAREIGVVRRCIDLFFEFEFANAMHGEVVAMVLWCMRLGSRVESDRTVWAWHLLGDEHGICLHKRILACVEKNRKSEAEGVRLGLMGHVTVLANTLQNEEALAAILAEDAAWTVYVQGELSHLNALNSTPIGFSSAQDLLTIKHGCSAAHLVQPRGAPGGDPERLPASPVSTPCRARARTLAKHRRKSNNMNPEVPPSVRGPVRLPSGVVASPVREHLDDISQAVEIQS